MVPLERYRELADFGESNDVFIEQGTALGARAVTEALAAAGLAAGDVDLILFTTVTGVAAPSLDALIAPLVGLRPDVKRMPLFGLGCVAGAAGIARVHDYLKSHPDEVAVLLSVELCTLTLQPGDRSAANMVATGLFGDGAAAVVLVGSRRAEQLGIDRRCPRCWTPARTCTRTPSAPWAGTSAPPGLKIVLDADVPVLVEKYLAGDVALLLDAHQLDSSEIAGWVCHPGGPKVIEAIQRDPGPGRRRAGADLALAGRDRQPVLVLGAARAGRHASPAAASSRAVPAC